MRPTYDVKTRPEAGWSGISAAVGLVVLTLAAQIGAEVELAGALGVLATAVTRFVGGALLPSS